MTGAPKLYERFLYPKMATHQKAIYVPPAYASGYNLTNEIDNLCCPADTHNPEDPGPNPECGGNCTLAMLEWGKGAYDWARIDERLVGLAPWHYYSTAKREAGVAFQPGLSELPQLLAAWQAIGREIISGQQRDIEFRRFGLMG
jgi:hypothetical protein